MKMLTLQYIPYAQIENLNSGQRISKLINIVKQENIVFLEGRLSKEEEADLIKRTMEQISSKFKGIEIATVYPDKKDIHGLKKIFLNALLGNRQGMTIIGPATIVKQIKKNPEKIQLLTQDKKGQRKK
ncbi:DUF2073 domain-containing protein [Candidatus Woesearchaeota archaeon]|nr:DUF2073 domain-containing protein [Candidatus Woesearchaeota archaeon]